MKILGICFLASVLVLFGMILGGCSDRTRYGCQTPENWDQPECQPPLCHLNDTCTYDLVGTIP